MSDKGLKQERKKTLVQFHCTHLQVSNSLYKLTTKWKQINIYSENKYTYNCFPKNDKPPINGF